MLSYCCNQECCCTHCISVVLLFFCALFILVEPFIVAKWGGMKTFLTICAASFLLVAIFYCHTCVTLERLMLIATLFVTAMGIVIAAQTLDDSKKTAEAQLIDKYNDKYFENDMYDALTSLWKVHKEYSDWFLPVRLMSHNDSFSISLKDENIENLKALLMNEKIDKDRRIVKRYFLNAYEMNRQGFISEKVLLEIIDKEGIKAFFCIVEPLELAKNKNYNYEPFFGIMEVCRKNKGTHFKCLNKK